MGDKRRTASEFDVPRPEDLDLLRRAASQLDTDQVLSLLSALSKKDADGVRRLKVALHVRIDPRRNLRAFADQVRRKLLGCPARVLPGTCSTLGSSVTDSAVELLGEHADHPTRSQLEAIIDPLIERHGTEAVRLCLATVACTEMPAAPELRALLRSDERLRLPEDRREVFAAGGGEPEGDGLDGGQRGIEEPDRDDDDRVGGAGRHSTETLEQRRTFEPLDRLLITTAIATLLGEEGSFEPEELVELVQGVVSLNSRRKKSYFHVGFVESLGLEIPPPQSEGMNEERWLWYWAGRLYGMARRNDREALIQVCDGEGLRWLFMVCATPEFGVGVADFVVEALAESDRVHLVEQFLKVLPVTERERMLGEPVFMRARAMLSTEPSSAATLFAALDRRLTALFGLRQKEPVPLPGPDPEELARTREFAFRVRRYLAASRRALGDFPSARAIAEELLASADELGPRSVALARVERALVEVGVRHLSDIRVPPPQQEQTIAERLDPVVEDLRNAFRSDPRSAQASYLLGIHAFCRKDYESSFRYLEVAESAMTGEEIYATTGLAAEAAFYQGLALLAQVDVARVDTAWAAISRSLDKGMRPHRDRVLEAAQALMVMDRQDRAVELVLRYAKGKSLRPFFEILAEAVGAGDLRATEALVQLGSKPPDVDDGDWLSTLVRGVRAAAAADRLDLAEGILDLADDLVQVGSRESLEMWLACVDGSSDLRELLGHEDAELRCVELLYRLGRPEEARERLEQLIWRIHDKPNYALEDLLGLWGQYGASVAAIDELRSRILGDGEEAEHPVVTVTDSPMTILFVGGNETQKQYREAIEAELELRYGSMVRVEWFFTGWSPNWGEHAERIERRFTEAAAMVIMQFVRTNLGRRLRRRAGEAGLPWIACTGHGRDAILRSVEQAVVVVSARR
ncbi:MAG: hypothetical protein KatS3mg008_2140 [Acidimicrobiales bacterium]|nr:MAG: hypothetical protein KatS3mg008_2140 [Acidimicrobiales bacterium]